MSGETSGLLWTFGSLLATAVFLAVIVWPLSVIMKARIAEGREERYRALAQAAVEAQEAVERRLADISAELATMRTHVAELQRLLKDVE